MFILQQRLERSNATVFFGAPQVSRCRRPLGRGAVLGAMADIASPSDQVQCDPAHRHSAINCLEEGPDMVKLYYAAGACSLSPHIVLRETQTPFTMVKVDLAAKKTEDGGDFWSKNPGGYVPALEADDGTIVTEGPVIVQYLGDKAGQLVPAFGSPERYRLMTWLNYITSELHKGFSPLFNPKVQDESKSVLRDRLRHRLGVVDKHLAAHDYLMGSEFSVADAYLFTVLNWTKRPTVAIDLASEFPNLAAFHARVAARPHVQAAMAAEGLA